MPLLPGKSQIGHNVTVEENAGKSHRQALAIALAVAYDKRKKKKKKE